MVGGYALLKKKSQKGNLKLGGDSMDIMDLIEILCFMISAFSLGYEIGSRSKRK